MAIAARTRSMFPTAKFVSFETTDESHDRAEPLAVLDADGKAIVSWQNWQNREALTAWAGSDG